MKIRGFIENRHLKSQRRLRYEDYLRSDRWKNIRELLFEHRGRRCEACGKTENLEVHHLTYRRLGQERAEDLMIVCPACHEWEDRKRKRRNRERYDWND